MVKPTRNPLRFLKGWSGPYHPTWTPPPRAAHWRQRPGSQSPFYFLGTPGHPLHLVLVTVPGEGIHLYEASQYQPLNSWLVPSDVTISGAAKLGIVARDASAGLKRAKHRLLASIAGSESESNVESELSSTIDTQNFHLLDDGYYLYALILKKDGCKTAWVWTVNGKRSEIEFGEPVYDLQPLEHGSPSGGACVVIFASGKVGLYSADLSRPLATSETGGSVFWAQVIPTRLMAYVDPAVLPDAEHCVIVASQEKGKLAIRALGISFETNAIAAAKTTPVLKSTPSLKTPSFSFWPPTGALFILGSDHVLYRTRLTFTEELEEPKRLAMRKLSNFAASIVALSSDHVALLGAERADGSIIPKLFLWDTKLSVLLHQQNVGEPILATKSQASNHVGQLDKVDNQLIVSLASTAGEARTEILLFPYRCAAESSLLDSLNKMEATIPFLALRDGSRFLTPPSSLPLAISDGSVSEISGLHALDARMCKELQSASATEDVFFGHLVGLEGVHTTALADRVLFPRDGLFFGNPSTLKVLTLSKGCGGLKLTLLCQEDYFALVPPSQIALVAALSPRYVSILVDKLASNYSSKVMTALLASSRVTSGTLKPSQGGLLFWLIQREDWINIQLALAVVLDITEEELEEFKDYLVALLGLILDYGFDCQLLLPSLARLSGEEVAFYLTILSQLLEAFTAPEALLADPSTHVGKIYRLLSSIIDVHFTNITSSEGLHPLLRRLQTSIRARMDALHALTQVELLVEPFVKRNLLLEEEGNPKRIRPYAGVQLPYRIEVFDLF
ncbi:hypothetical protein L0F63_004308 [Massospora cicadina]|nr:hypothetical protein L0F63_004308 [Massospora cicadina]